MINLLCVASSAPEGHPQGSAAAGLPVAAVPVAPLPQQLAGERALLPLPSPAVAARCSACSAIETVSASGGGQQMLPVRPPCGRNT